MRADPRDRHLATHRGLGLLPVTMEPAREELAAAIEATTFSTPTCPVYQNVVAKVYDHPGACPRSLHKKVSLCRFGSDFEG